MTLRKFLSILCTVAMLVAMGAIAAPVTTVSAATTTTQGFEPSIGYHHGNAEISADYAHSGNYAAKLTITGSTNNNTCNRVTYADANGPVEFTPGKTYHVSMWVYSTYDIPSKLVLVSDPDLSNMAPAGWINGKGKDMLSSSYGYENWVAGEWMHIEDDITLPAQSGETVTHLSVGIACAEANLSLCPYTVYIDDVSIKETDAEGEAYVHTFDNGYTPSYVYGDAAVSTAQKKSGTGSLKITVDNAATSTSTDRVVLVDTNGNPIASKAGYKYILSVWYYTEDEFVGKVRFLRDTNPAGLPSIDSGKGEGGYDHIGQDLTNGTLTTGVWTQVTKTVESQTGNDAYWSLGVAATSNPAAPVTVYLDDVQVIEIPPNEAATYESALNGKSALFSGDSIAAGWRDTAFNKADYSNGGGWSARLEKQWLMTTTKAALAGNSLTVIPDRGHIIQQLHNNKSGTFDYVILEGGFNDCMGENVKGNSNMEAIPKLGTISESFDVADFDTSTFAGSFEELLYYATTYFPEAAIGFIVTYQTPDSQYGGITGNVAVTNEGYKQEDYFNLQMAICDKWNVPFLDLWSGQTADGKAYSGDIIDVDGGTVHFPGSGDNIHLDTAGYDVITPYIAGWMETLTPYEAPENVYHKMNPITSVYQYVGGEQDNSSIGGAATAGSAVYTHTDGSLRTAFRVAATYETDSEDFDTILLNGVSYPIEERGIILGRAGQTLTVDSPAKVAITTGFKAKHWKYEDGTVTYTALVKNVTKEQLNTAYIARSYVKITVGGNEQVVYSDTSVSFTPQSIYQKASDILVAGGGTAPIWFPKRDHTDDGYVDLT